MDSLEVKNTIDELNYAFTEFKRNNEEKLQELEKKGNVDGLLDVKLAKINHHLDQTQDRLRRLEVGFKRPQLSSSQEEEDFFGSQDLAYKKAFSSYIRKGENHLHLLEKKALTSRTNEEGGYLIPPPVARKVNKALSQGSMMRSVANVMTISSDALELLTERSEADVAWAGEGEKRSETATPELGKVQIPVHEMYARPRATQKLLDDASIDIENWLVDKIAEKMARLENASFIKGDGKGKPLGFLGCSLKAAPDWEWGSLEQIVAEPGAGFKGELGAEKLMEVFYALKPTYLNEAVWLMSRSALAALRKLKDTSTGNYLWQPSLALNVPATLLGYPVVIDDDMPAFGEEKAHTPIAFGSFKQGYQIVDRSDIHVLRDPFSTKPYVEFYTTKRVGGGVIDFQAIKVLSFSAPKQTPAAS